MRRKKPLYGSRRIVFRLSDDEGIVELMRLAGNAGKSIDLQAKELVVGMLKYHRTRQRQRIVRVETMLPERDRE